MTATRQAPNARLLDGREVADLLLDKVAAALERRQDRPPSLAVVQVGDDPASKVYVRNKRRACDRVGIVSRAWDLSAETSEAELLSLVDRLNLDAEIDGILVQLPLPAHIDEIKVTNRVHAGKDVDGFHAFNVGQLALRQPGLRPCTPRGVMTLLDHYGLDPKGRHAVVVGASNIVGRPLSLELLLAGATVTTCHRFTSDLATHVRAAEMLFVAVGRPDIVDSGWIAPGAVVVDIGIHRGPDRRLRGDLDFESAAARAGWITPVPGGVGPMTVATLMQNTAEAAGVRLTPDSDPA